MKKTLSLEHDAMPLGVGKSGNGRSSLLSPTVLVAFKETLTQQHTVITRKLKTFEDGNSTSGTIDDSLEPLEAGTYSWYVHVSDSEVAVKHRLSEQYQQVTQSLARIEGGTYGICERCHNTIELARLKAMPTAILCSICKG
ncbi:TraR/DksA C4-type zinc finger protein [Candidatus Microgenomates bacterium]|nr:TraR/DksA C4-type zinc finger protein [Candidatus Microgenomates bacterium]